MERGTSADAILCETSDKGKVQKSPRQLKLPSILRLRREEEFVRKFSQTSAPPTLDYRPAKDFQPRSVGGTESRRPRIIVDDDENGVFGCLPCKNFVEFLNTCCRRESEASRRARRLGDDFVGKSSLDGFTQF